jgi:hypothetical protein
MDLGLGPSTLDGVGIGGEIMTGSLLMYLACMGRLSDRTW